MRLRLSGYSAGILLTALAVASATTGLTAPLDPATCEQLQARLDGLRKDGVEADMALGPEVARTTLPIDRFNRIGTYIEVDEQLNFRCGLGKQRVVLPTTIEGGEEEIPAPGEAAATGGAPAAAPPVPRKAPPPVKGAAVGSDAAPPAPKKAAPAVKKQPKAAKAADAPADQPKTAPKSTVKSAPKPPAKDDAAKKAAPKKKQPPKADDAYRPPPKSVARDGDAAPAARQ